MYHTSGRWYEIVYSIEFQYWIKKLQLLTQILILLLPLALLMSFIPYSSKINATLASVIYCTRRALLIFLLLSCFIHCFLIVIQVIKMMSTNSLIKYGLLFIEEDTKYIAELKCLISKSPIDEIRLLSLTLEHLSLDIVFSTPIKDSFTWMIKAVLLSVTILGLKDFFSHYVFIQQIGTLKNIPDYLISVSISLMIFMFLVQVTYRRSKLVYVKKLELVKSLLKERILTQ